MSARRLTAADVASLLMKGFIGWDYSNSPSSAIAAVTLENSELDAKGDTPHVHVNAAIEMHINAFDVIELPTDAVSNETGIFFEQLYNHGNGPFPSIKMDDLLLPLSIDYQLADGTSTDVEIVAYLRKTPSYLTYQTQIMSMLITCLQTYQNCKPIHGSLGYMCCKDPIAKERLFARLKGPRAFEHLIKVMSGNKLVSGASSAILLAIRGIATKNNTYLDSGLRIRDGSSVTMASIALKSAIMNIAEFSTVSK